MSNDRLQPSGRVLAPILCFTADEAWEHAGHDAGEIHLSCFPKPDPLFSGSEATDKVNALMAYRNIIQQAIEPLRQDKVIRANNEASVTLRIPEAMPQPLDLLAEEDAVKEFFIVSEIIVSREGTVPAASAEKSTYGKCPRCWRLFPELTQDDTLCARCASAVG